MKNDFRNAGTMKRLCTIAILAVSIMVIVTGVMAAEEAESTELSESTEQGIIKPINLLTWLTSDPPNWGQGVLYAFLGGVGALVIVYSFIGGVFPGTTGKARIDEHTAQLKNVTERLKELIDESDLNVKAIEVIGKVVNDLRDDLWAERRRQFEVAAGIYITLGALFSALLAQDMLQAIVIGAGWTSFVGTLGLNKDYEKRKSDKDTTLDDVLSEAKELGKKAISLLEKNIAPLMEEKVISLLEEKGISLLEEKGIPLTKEEREKEFLSWEMETKEALKKEFPSWEMEISEALKKDLDALEKKVRIAQRL